MWRDHHRQSAGDDSEVITDPCPELVVKSSIIINIVMKKFLFKILFLGSVITVVALPLDFFLSANLKKSSGYQGEFEVMNDIYDGKAACDVAIYGSSRAWVHINPEILERSIGKTVYNFGIDGHNFWLQYLRHLEFIKHNPKPDQILLSVDIFTLQKRKDLYKSAQFLPYMLWNGNIKQFTSSYEGFTNNDYGIPLVRYTGRTEALSTALKNAFLPENTKKFRHKGFAGVEKNWNSDLEKAIANRSKYVVTLDKATVELFEKFIRECKRSNTGLTLIYTPEYIDGQRFVAKRGEIMNVYKTFAKKYDLLFIDYSDDGMCFQKDFFYNASHLNSKGADLFTLKLSNRLKAEQHGHFANAVNTP